MWRGSRGGRSEAMANAESVETGVDQPGQEVDTGMQAAYL